KQLRCPAIDIAPTGQAGLLVNFDPGVAMTRPYNAHAIPIRGDLAAAQARASARIARPGAWWDGAQRIAIAAETRNAAVCGLCRARKAALSPSAVTGTHDSLGRLPEAVVEIVHRVCTDPGRLSEPWYRSVL